MLSYPVPNNNTRLGISYFPDTVHFRLRDLHAWLPELHNMGISWLRLQASTARAIPETFLTGLIENNIEPVIHFPITLEKVPTSGEMISSLEAYSQWGIHYVCFFDRPNLKKKWTVSNWVQSDLVERFLDTFLPLADTAFRSGLYPVFPPLEPGGDYWDTAFLRLALQSIQRRGYTKLLEKLIIGAYGWADEHPLQWGVGGPERWPGAYPYFTPEGEQDQRGFRIFDWYETIIQAVLGNTLPIILMGGGPQQLSKESIEKTIKIARLLVDESIENLDPVPTDVLCCHLGLLTAESGDPKLERAWYRPDGWVSPVVKQLQRWVAEDDYIAGLRKTGKYAAKTLSKKEVFPINHYLLLPRYEWGISDWHLDVIKPFVRKYKPVIGFSIDEAKFAARITVVGGEQVFPEVALNQLRLSGCLVERVEGDGTEIATQLATM